MGSSPVQEGKVASLATSVSQSQSQRGETYSHRSNANLKWAKPFGLLLQLPVGLDLCTTQHNTTHDKVAVKSNQLTSFSPILFHHSSFPFNLS
ncbi:hypothetical protein V6N13_044462 [Hibiscus sabdariffa]|uniref:Uncharacterized protein n=1 Tax=Hibiscus sabdariffa TaxID=183260 RepID=A0ABR2RI81_9ROSI